MSVIDIEDIDQSALTTPFVTDITYELNGSCLWDCAKFHYTLEHGTLTIMLLRAGSHEKADSTVETLHNEFLPTAWVEYTMDDLSNMPPGSWVIVDPPSSIRDTRTSTASISYGSIVIFITYSQSFCDYEPGYGRMCEGDLEALALNSVKFMTAQMKKLEEMGYPK